jgi:hypothetical protein
VQLIPFRFYCCGELSIGAHGQDSFIALLALRIAATIRG